MSLSAMDPISLAVFLGALAVLPLLILCTTSMLKMAVVLAIVRNAIGIQQVPPSMAIYAIALAATAFVMAPTVKRSVDLYTADSTPGNVSPGSASIDLARAGNAAEPFRDFMVKNTTPEERGLFVEMARKHWPREMSREMTDRDYVVVMPAFVVSQLQQAFEIGFLLYVPFVVIDLLVSNLLLALGMQMVSPMVISLPLKLLLFVQLDGWGRLFTSLVDSY